jgi:addiction module RelE/StbE family toxin
MIFKIEYLPRAKNEIDDIAEYIAIELHSPNAADNLLAAMEKSISRLERHPFSCPVYYSDAPLEHEYRKLVVKNYIIYYYVDEAKKLVTIARVIHANINHGEILKNQGND